MQIDNLDPHHKWSTKDISHHQVVLQASPGTTMEINIVTWVHRVDLSTGNIGILQEHQVGTLAEGGLRDTKMGEGELLRLGENKMGTTEYTVWRLRRQLRRTMSTIIQFFPPKICTRHVLTLASQTDSPICG